MKASFENDPVRGPGYGLFRLKELDIPTDDPHFSLRRSGDQLCLAAGDWQEAEEHLRPDSFHFEDGGLVLAVSSSVVDRLDPLQIYRLTLFGAASPQRATLELQHVCYSPLAQGCAVADAARPPVVPAAPAAPVTPPPVVEAEPEQPLNMAQQPVAKSSSGLWLAVGGLLLCLAIGGGVWWYMDSSRAAQAELQQMAEESALAQQAAAEKAASEQAEQEKLAAEKAAQDKAEADKLAAEKVAAEKAEQERLAAEKAAQDKAEADKLAAETAAAENAAQERLAQEKLAQEAVVPVRSAKEQVHEFLRGTGSPAEALTLSKQLPATTPDDQDALFLLMESAAEGGNAEAMLTVARFYNPADSTPSGTIIKDAEQAFNWLTKARDVPETAAGATKGLDALRNWLQPRAASDAMAKSLLDRMEK